MLKELALRRLLWAMSRQQTFYVLGAGASYGLIPVTAELRRKIESEYHSVGVYSVARFPQSPLFERVIGDVSHADHDPRRKLLEHMPPGALDLLVQKALWRPKSGVIPPQYAVFEFVPAPATFFNFNLDGLASLHCAHRHIVLEPHGRIDDYWLDRGRYREFLEATVLYEIQIPHHNFKLLPAPETHEIVSRTTYARAVVRYQMSSVMVILGYSFGQRNNTLDDAYSFEFLVSLLRQNPRPVLVVSPTPLELAERLRDALKTYNVYGIPLRWEFFSGLLLASINSGERIGPLSSTEPIRKFLYLYERGSDGPHA